MKTYWIYYVILISLGLSASICLNWLNPSIAFDDAYTMRMTQHSFADILRITSQDVHPPLYYWLLKIYSSAFGYSMYAQRAFSTLAIFATMLLAIFPIRKNWGERTALLFLVLLIAFPATQFLESEIRMYSWAMFFTLATSVFAYQAYNTGKKMDYVLLGFWGLCAAYTHYYATMTVGWTYLILFIFLWRQKKGKRIYFITVAITAILYTPWLSELLFQIRQVSNHYWIEPISASDIYYHIYFLFSIKKDWIPLDDSASLMLMLGTAIIISLQVIIIGYSFVSYAKRKSKWDLAVIIAISLFMLPILSGLAVSYFSRPVLVPRYMLCSFGLFILGLSIAYCKYWGQRYLRPIILTSIILLSVSSLIRYWGTTLHLETEQKEAASLNTFIEANAAGTNIFLGEHYGASALSRISVLYPDKNYYILTFTKSTETFAPFNLTEVYRGETFAKEFIYIQKSENESGEASRNFKKLLMQNYLITDSIKALNMELYKVRSLYPNH